eukprot:204801_1
MSTPFTHAILIIFSILLPTLLNAGNNSSTDQPQLQVIKSFGVATYISVCASFGVVTLVLVLIVALYHFIITYHKYKHSQLDFKTYPSLTLSYLLMIIGIIFNINLCIFAFDLNDKTICYYGKYGGIPLYSIFKLLLYLILLCRVWVLFKDIYNINSLKVGCLSLIIWCIMNIALCVTGSDIIWVPNERPSCYIIPSTLSLASIGFLDITSGIITAYLFIKPVLLKQKKKHKSNRQQLLAIKAIKQCILTLIAILTSIFALIAIALLSMPQVFAGTDILISIISIIFMYEFNSKIGDKICCFFWCLPNQSIHIEPNQSNNNMNTNNNLQSITTDKNQAITIERETKQETDAHNECALAQM